MEFVSRVSKDIGVLVNLPREVVDMIDDRIGGPTPSGSPGVYGSGRSGWVRDVVYEKLEIEDTRVKPATQIPVARINLELLDEMEHLVVRLARQFTVPHVIRYLDQHKVPPPRGKRWHSHQVLSIINAAAAKTFTWMIGKLETVEELGDSDQNHQE